MVDTVLADTASECLKNDLQRARDILIHYVSGMFLVMCLGIVPMCMLGASRSFAAPIRVSPNYFPGFASAQPDLARCAREPD